MGVFVLKKFVLFILTMITLLSSCVVVYSESDTLTDTDLLNRLRVLRDFKFRAAKQGIGEGVFPVYSAPSSDSLRYANGKSRCDISKDIGEAGYDGSWLMIRYTTSTGQLRVGYIEAGTAKDYKSTMSGPNRDRIIVTAANQILITDDPFDKHEPFGTIHQGETFYILSKYTYTGSWWYVECFIDGQRARGFIDRKTSSFYLGNVVPTANTKAYDLYSIGYPDVSPNGVGIIGNVQINSDQRQPVREKPDAESTQITVAYKDRYYPCYGIKDGRRTVWYYIWVEEDSKWGWVSSKHGTYVPNQVTANTNVNREFCTVESIQTNYFILKNTLGELYFIDTLYLGNLKEGDLALLIYTNRNDRGDGTYKADVTSVFPSENNLQEPAP